MTGETDRRSEAWDRLDPDIRRAIRRLIDQSKPSCVILFGSYGGGRERPDSDIDVIFIVEERPSRRVEVQLRKRWRQMQREMPALPTIDLLVYAPEEFVENFVVGFVPYEALRDGIVLYGRPPAVGQKVVGKSR